MEDQTGSVSHLLRAWGRGDLQARDELVPVVYRELRRRAVAYLRRERSDHTLQPTAPVHEAYLRLTAQDRVTWQNRAHFFAITKRPSSEPDAWHEVDASDSLREAAVRFLRVHSLRAEYPV